MKILDNELWCVGCGVCAEVCSKSCITMETFQGGFVYPKIDEDKCISCQKCRRVCPVLKEKVRIEPKKCYALLDDRKEKRIKSASGGASALFFEEILGNGGAICGCRLDDELRPIHDVSCDADSVDLYRDSKYVQSNMQPAWAKIAEQLKQNKKVMVAGTPCQIAAVHSHFGENENIITCDFVCSGVPDPSVFELYKKELEQKQGKKITEFYFRDKTNGWKKSNIRVVYADGTEQIIERKDSYYFKLFGSNLYFRECCYNCRFKDFNTRADLTVGDYWGIEKLHPEIDDNKGCSLVIVNTEKGAELLSAVSDKCTIIETPLDFAIETHPKLEKSISRYVYRDMFYGIYKPCDADSLCKAIDCCTGKSLLNKLNRKIYYYINKLKRGKRS